MRIVKLSLIFMFTVMITDTILLASINPENIVRKKIQPQNKENLHNQPSEASSTLAVSTVYIPPGTSKDFSRKTTAGSTFSYDFDYDFPSGISAEDLDVYFNEYHQVVMEFSISVDASVPIDQSFSGYVEFDLYNEQGDLIQTCTYDLIVISGNKPPNRPPVLSNGKVEPLTGPKSSTFKFRYSVIYKDPDGDIPFERFLELNVGSDFRAIANLEIGTGDYINGIELYNDQINGDVLRWGLNNFRFQATDFAHLYTYLPETGTFNGPYIGDPIITNFCGTPTAGTKPLAVTFTNLSTGSFNNVLWNFGDGNTSAEFHATHTYNAVGQFTVILTTSNAVSSVSETKTNYITVTEPPPIAAFSAAPTSGNKPLNVQFSNQSTGSISGYSWTFGDGGTSTETSPSHSYTNIGTYTVVLSVTGPGGSNTKTRTNYINVAEPPIANFSGTPTLGNKPLNVQFTNQSTGSITTYAWTFGDGGTSTDASPSHSYATAGTYNVALTVTGPGGSNSKTRTSYITVNEPAPVADFTGTPTSGNKPLNVQFTNQSTGSITTYAWTFGDGGTSTETGPSHSYANAGTYTVALTVTGSGGSDTETKTNYITVTEPPPNVAFTATPTSGNKPLNVQFTNQSTGVITTYGWTFGDGGTSTEASPSHSYANAGTYTVALTVTGPGGSDIETKTNYITVSENAPVAEFTATPTSGNKPLSVQFTNQSTGVITTYGWIFGDGGTSTEASPTHSYANAGTYTVALTVTGPGGSDTETKNNYITVTESTPVADFTGTPTSGNKPLSVSFTDQSTGSITSCSWNFGDGSTRTDSNPTHIYENAGTFTVTLTVTGEGGTDTENKTNYITVTENSDVRLVNNQLPTTYKLNQNYPNPFNPETSISFEIPKPSNVRICIYNSSGFLIDKLVDDYFQPGKYEIAWCPSSMIPSGMYVIFMKAGSFQVNRKSLFLK